MQVKSIAECSKGSILQITSDLRWATIYHIPFVINVLYFFERLFYTGFTVGVIWFVYVDVFILYSWDYFIKKKNV